MGSPLGLTLANAFLCHYEKIWLNECTSQFTPVVYRRYVMIFKKFFRTFKIFCQLQLYKFETYEYKIYL